MKTLAIETSCDDTSLGIISYDGETFQVDKLIAYSQIKEHQPFGGVLPEIASRLHSEKIIRLLQEIGFEEIEKVDFISVTAHPGLPGSLVVGKSTAQLLGARFQKPVKEINHIHGHIFSILLERKKSDLQLPMVMLTASGGHNDLYLVTKQENSPDRGRGSEAEEGVINTQTIGEYRIQKIGYTLDDASGEAFDKVSKMLGGPYPGGPRISQQALQGKPNPEFHFKRILLPKDQQGNYLFSFSGMKSQVAFLLDKRKKEGKTLSQQDIADIAYEFQEATIETLANRLLKASKEHGTKTIALAGGVSANNRLVEYLSQEIETHNQEEYIKEHNEEVAFLYPTKKVYSTDNGAMIGLVGILTNYFNS
ncbi:MAG: tRNA (adenosine(37)-N6)-threonylcarbamoyltransferase complex transferase subunit TsaD [Candidatus Absconditabacteria bacterium]|nr:tRNA (adenosine(37)-N6)-threonylcarbamoyltransferase complex transferase subunit TsaD [Candidatus Absconditabacteria bacterium]MDD3868625.1 tRNA (adenosine(37)-N6)-threonylcarbamoyltransferase complex transferase subunit TsaD [Candidatus Absconditabacteria bacterium]MDD4714145.1 tRNA (adenosine(37)-N6)-threonylcarbamoyltransferase complex transferase subunit TsaD [Candidatus Absconditabacteria bacterium]